MSLAVIRSLSSCMRLAESSPKSSPVQSSPVQSSPALRFHLAHVLDSNIKGRGVITLLTVRN